MSVIQLADKIVPIVLFVIYILLKLCYKAVTKDAMTAVSLPRLAVSRIRG